MRAGDRPLSGRGAQSPGGGLRGPRGPPQHQCAGRGAGDREGIEQLGGGRSAGPTAARDPVAAPSPLRAAPPRPLRQVSPAARVVRPWSWVPVGAQPEPGRQRRSLPHPIVPPHISWGHPARIPQPRPSGSSRAPTHPSCNPAVTQPRPTRPSPASSPQPLPIHPSRAHGPQLQPSCDPYPPGVPSPNPHDPRTLAATQLRPSPYPRDPARFASTGSLLQARSGKRPMSCAVA